MPGRRPGRARAAAAASIRQRPRPELDVHRPRLGALAAFHQPRRAVAAGAPQPAPLPPRVRTVDTPVEALGVEAQRVRDAAALNLPPTATREEVMAAKLEAQRQAAVAILGLPANATMTDVYLARARSRMPNSTDIFARARDAAAKGRKSVPTQPAPNSNELRKLQEQRREEQRVLAVKELKLPETATWEEINRERLRIATARSLKLPETATWEEIERAKQEMMRPRSAPGGK